MPNRVQLTNTADFTGGLNLRADQFTIDGNQVPWVLNMEIDTRFGARSRKGWGDWQTFPADEESWNPRSLFAHTTSSGSEVLFAAAADKLWSNYSGGFEEITGFAATADPHGADFAAWGEDVYVACGRGNKSVRWVGGVVTALDGDEWSPDYTEPGSGQMPSADLVAANHGYLWVANTLENGEHHAQRLRWSHPNDPDAWANLDYIDFPEGNGPITGIMPFRDHMLVFFPTSVWALYGTNDATWQKANVTKTVGAASRQCLTRSESAVYFVSWPEGVYAVGAESVSEVSGALRPAFDTQFFGSQTDLQWLSWADQKLYWTVPFAETFQESGSTSTFVFDPSINAWTLWQAGNGDSIAPIVGSAVTEGPVGCSRSVPTLVQFNAFEEPTDFLGGEAYDFPTVLRTPWQDAGYPTIRKRWKRPDYILLETTEPHQVEVLVFHDLQETGARRTRYVYFEPSTSALFWEDDGGDPLHVWETAERIADDANPATPSVVPRLLKWGSRVSGSVIERSGSLGNASAVQLELRGEAGKTWGLTALVWKSILRKVR